MFNSNELWADEQNAVAKSSYPHYDYISFFI